MVLNPSHHLVPRRIEPQNSIHRNDYAECFSSNSIVCISSAWKQFSCRICPGWWLCQDTAPLELTCDPGSRNASRCPSKFPVEAHQRRRTSLHLFLHYQTIQTDITRSSCRRCKRKASRHCHQRPHVRLRVHTERSREPSHKGIPCRPEFAQKLQRRFSRRLFDGWQPIRDV